MAKAVVYSLLATAFFILLVFLPSNHHGRARSSLSRRLGYRSRMPAFDPLVTRIGRSVEERTSSNDSNNEYNPMNSENNISYVPEVADAHEYFSDDGTLNVTLRLFTLFPLLDTAPRDGVISPKELETWNVQQALDRLRYRTHKEMSLRDKNLDGTISFSEYLPQFSINDIDKNDMAHGEAGWWMKQFTNADVDSNGSLDFDEFNNFLHPEDSNNGEIQKWLLGEKIKRMDDDHDGKLNFMEFVEHAYHIFKAYIEFETTGSHVPTAEEKFADLDVNKDKFLEVEELKPILPYLYPGELSYAKHYTGYLIHEADDNKDGNLSLEEMLSHEDLFYNTVYDEGMEDEDDYDDFHDEL